MSGYRGIRPVLAFDGQDHPLNRRQFHWVRDGEHTEVATLAGKEMTVFLHDDGRYGLSYLDLAYPQRFATREEAKGAAGDFARAVLLTMLAYVGVREDDVELQYCLRSFGLWGNEPNDEQT